MTAPRRKTTKGTHARVLALLKAALPPGSRVLDAPAGQGALCLDLKNAGFSPHGIECDPDEFKLNDVPVTLCDLNEPLPFADASFDALACVDGIEHIENPFALIREAHRVLRPGGSLVISTPNIMALRSRLRFLLTGFHHKFKTPLSESARRPEHHINPLTFQELRYALHTAGFRIGAVAINRIKLVSYPYIMLWPLVVLRTLLAFRREKDPAQRLRNAEIARTLFSPAVLLGETLIIQAEKHTPPEE